MSLFLKHQSLVLERNNHPGGHASSVMDKGYTFDNGPHIMFSRNKEILDFMIKILGKNIHLSKRNNKIIYKNRVVKYPFENDLKSLPPEDNFECLKSFVFNPYKKKYRNPKNLKQWFLYHFGQGICEKYLFPYNEKVWKIPVDKLSMSWSARIPNPPPDDIIRSAIGFETEGYLHQLHYHYPSKGGYQAISNSLAKHANIKYGFNVKKIIKKNKKFLVSNEKEILEFDSLVSTMPIQELIKIVDIKIPKKVLKAIKKLIVNPIYTTNLGIKGEDKNKYTAVYFPESKYWFNRLSFPATFSPHNSPGGHYSIQAEVTATKNSSLWRKKDSEILNHTINGLVETGFIKNKKDIVYQKVVRHDYAYVVYDTKYDEAVKIVREWFPKQGIHLVGRFSYFEYINVDAVIERSMEIAGRINKKPVKLNNYVKKFSRA